MTTCGRTIVRNGMIEQHDPSTGEFRGSVPVMTAEQVREAVVRSHKAQKSWGKTSFKQRSAVLASLMKFVLAHQDEIVDASCRESGKTKLEAEMGEVLTTLEKCRYTMKYGSKALASETRSPPLFLSMKRARIEYVPLGVIAAIIPWNYPFHNAFSAIISSIFAGNGCCVKVSEYSSVSAAWFSKIMREILVEHGQDPELVQFLTGDGSTGSALINAGVSKVLFIGSPQVGRRVMETAAKTLTPVILELGGKDAFIITDECDFDEACTIAMRGAFTNNGQNCVASERIYVHEKVYDVFVEKMTALVRSLTQGPPLEGHFDSGAMTMCRQLDIVQELVNDATAKGARCLAGGRKNPKYPNGQFFEPTLLVDCTHNMKVINEEAFGPIMAVVKFKTDEEVVEMANATDYGLSSVVFCTNPKRSERIAKGIVAGTVVMNDFGIPYLIQDLPFGGVKVSGFGQFNGPEGLRAFSHPKVVVSDRWGLRAKAPAFTKYPIPQYSFPLVKSAMHFVYGFSVCERVSGLWNLVSIALKKTDTTNTKKEE
eukprot:ANDGO_01057.mRNA.1 Aldehyde dehydrogenase 22A1